MRAQGRWEACKEAAAAITAARVGGERPWPWAVRSGLRVSAVSPRVCPGLLSGNQVDEE